MDPKKKFFLFKQSKNFCAVPWNYLKVSMDGEVYTCMIGSEVLGNIHEASIQDIAQSATLNRIRNNLSSDTSDKNCTFCVSFENGDQYQYLRGLYNPMFLKSDVDYTDANKFNLSGIDLHWGSTCNLKCITCWHKQSSAIAQEQNMPILNVKTDAANNLIDFIVENQFNLQEIYMSGGEPTLIKHNLRLLQRLDKSIPAEIRINTNMMFDSDNEIINEIKQFKNVRFTISADTSNPEQFNFIRRGADWHKFINTLTELKQLHFKWRVNSVFFAATALSLADTQEYFMNEFDIHDFTINQINLGHTYLQSRNLPESVKAIAHDRLLTHRDKYKDNHNLCGQLTNCLTELENPITEDYRNYLNSVSTEWHKIFPEIA